MPQRSEKRVTIRVTRFGMIYETYIGRGLQRNFRSRLYHSNPRLLLSPEKPIPAMGFVVFASGASLSVVGTERATVPTRPTHPFRS